MSEYLVYRWYDADDVLLYVGMTNDIERRKANHQRSSPWCAFAVRCEIDARRTSSRDEVLRWEREEIASESPIFNRTVEAVGFAVRQREYLARRGVDWSDTPHSRYGHANRANGPRPPIRKEGAPRRLGASALGVRDKVIPLRLRADEMELVKRMAAEDGLEPASWLYLRLQEGIATERRKRRRRAHD